MRVLVVGYGSIGKRHARVLKQMDCEVGIVSRRKINYEVVFSNLLAAIEQFGPEYIVIANETSEHYTTISLLAESGFDGVVLVEKPLFHENFEIPYNIFKGCYVAYDMRFLPVLVRAKELVNQERVISVQAYVGQYLPEWRPHQDYRTCYSALKEQGGGVLRDLSHEIDYLEWIFGSWRRICAVGGHHSNLEITSDDVWAIMIEMDKCPIVSLQMNYLDRVARRFMSIQTETKSIYVDFIANCLYVNEKKEEYTIHSDDTYRAEHKAVLEKNIEKLCSFSDGKNVLNLIEAIELSAKKGVWISR